MQAYANIDPGIFLLSSLFGLMGCYLSYKRMQQSDWRQLHLYHTWLCIPMVFHFSLVSAWLAASLCLVGGIRTLILAGAWGQKHKKKVVFMCLCCPVFASLWTATHFIDWLLLCSTIIAVGAEGQNCMIRLRYASLVNAGLWVCNAFVFGALMGVIFGLSSIFSNLKALSKQFNIRFFPRRIGVSP